MANSEKNATKLRRKSEMKERHEKEKKKLTKMNTQMQTINVKWFRHTRLIATQDVEMEEMTPQIEHLVNWERLQRLLRPTALQR